MDTIADSSALVAGLGSLPERPEQLRRLSPLVLVGTGTHVLAHGLLGRLLLRGERVIVLDGANSFDAYRLAQDARRFRRPPPTLLSAVRVSRAFTWPQWLALLEGEAQAEAARTGARWVVALGPLDLFADENVKPFQAWRGVRRTAEGLRTLSAAGLGVIAAQDERPLREGGRIDLLDRLRSAAGHLVEVSPQAETPLAPVPSEAHMIRQLSFGFAE
jgi:hypothetical protein